ncbi:MAG: hypothetical protein WDA72_07440 [Desulfomonilia bacterium]|jgi:hypothetical protein|nr:hypothetical protein [Deltaproteobacteria bacterium]MDX9760964.1 hypothetical protein [Desulfomonilia bacterium]HPW67865.1 hypothetical protein [Deltaproteobacteria bacterium]
MDTPILATMSDTEIDHYVSSISLDNLSEVCLQIRIYCEHIQRIARKRNDLSPEARIMIENLAKLSKAIADVGLISSLETPRA